LIDGHDGDVKNGIFNANANAQRRMTDCLVSSKPRGDSATLVRYLVVRMQVSCSPHRGPLLYSLELSKNSAWSGDFWNYA
jgi:hypothetical protein